LKKVKITSEYILYDSIAELEPDVQKLMQKAIEARTKAYAPYSKFSVGAALLLDNGKIIKGSNQENAAYPNGLCAERVAIFSAHSNYPDNIILKLAISASSALKIVDQPVSPCGSCRQAIAEYEGNQNKAIQIYFMGETGNIIEVNALKDLLPLSFDKSFL
jgi:cytidine deaminase